MHIKALLKSTPTQPCGWSHDCWGAGKCARVSAGVSWRSKDRNAHLCFAVGAAGDGSRQFNCTASSWPVQLCCGFLVLMKRTAASLSRTCSWRWWAFLALWWSASLALFDHFAHPRLLSVSTRVTLCLHTQDQAWAKLWPVGQILIHLVELGDMLLASESWNSCISSIFLSHLNKELNIASMTSSSH